jgi:hypothetical protein
MGGIYDQQIDGLLKAERSFRHYPSLAELLGWSKQIEYKPGWQISVEHLGWVGYGLRVVFYAMSSVTGIEDMQYGRLWHMPISVTKSQFFMTALKAILTAEEHEAREFFKVNGIAVFGPHVDVDKLAEAMGR